MRSSIAHIEIAGQLRTLVAAARLRTGGMRETLRQDWQLYVLLAPLMIWFAVFLYAPMGGLLIAFKDYSLFKGAAGSPWIGLENFLALIGDEQFHRAVINTVTNARLNYGALTFPRRFRFKTGDS